VACGHLSAKIWLGLHWGTDAGTMDYREIRERKKTKFAERDLLAFEM
jgi:hypothetical protein